MKKREKKAVFSKFKRAMATSGAAAAILASSVIPAYAVEQVTPLNEVVEEQKTVKPAAPINETEKEIILDFTENIFSNTDAERRTALGKKYNIQLDFTDVWEDKGGQKTIGTNGVQGEYTSHDKMKAMGFYAVNANRQELIKYALRTGDWKPYDQYELDLIEQQKPDLVKTATEDVKVPNDTSQSVKVASTQAIAAPTEPTQVTNSTSSEVVTNVPTVVNVIANKDAELKTEVTPVVTVDPVLTNIDPMEVVAVAENKQLTAFDSNNDQERRAAIENAFDIKLDASDKWEDKAGQKTINPDGTVSEYTSHDTMKALGFYAVNANRQELIQYGIRTDNWQPYRAFAALSEPAYFELVGDKIEYSKVYYAKDFENTRMNYATDVTMATVSQAYDKVKEIQAEMLIQLSAIVEKYKAAPGPNMYVVGLNSNESYSKEWGVEQVENGFFDSELNHPDVMGKGIYKDGHNPFTKLFQ